MLKVEGPNHRMQEHTCPRIFPNGSWSKRWPNTTQRPINHRSSSKQEALHYICHRTPSFRMQTPSGCESNA